MTLSGAISWEVRTAGSDNYGGGYAGDASLATPSAPSLSTSTTGGTVAANTYYVVVCYRGGGSVEGPKSVESSITTTGATSTITVTSPATSSGAATWAVYFGTTSGGPYFQEGTGLTIGSNRTRTTTPPTSGTQPFGVDYSQQSPSQKTVDGVTITGTVQATTTQLKLTGTTVSSADVGNLYQSVGGTATAGVYEIRGILGTDTWIMDRSMGTNGQTSTGDMGGAMATPGKVYSAKVAGNNIHVKSGNYDLSASANVAGGRINETTGGSSGAYSRLIGYGSTRNDNGTRPVFRPSANTVTLITLGASRNKVENIEFAPNGFTGCQAITDNSTSSHIVNCKFNGALGAYNGNTAAGAKVRGCYSTGNTGGFSLTNNSHIMECTVENCTDTTAAIKLNGTSSTASHCLAFGAGATNSAHFWAAQDGCTFINCTSYGNTASGGDGFATSGINNAWFLNCVSYGNNDRGFKGNANTGMFLVNCASGSNGTEYAITDFYPLNVSGFITLTADPFTNAAGSDFTLNDAAGGGALLRAAGFPTAMPGLSPANYRSVGAYQDGNASNVSGSARILGSSIIQGMGVI